MEDMYGVSLDDFIEKMKAIYDERDREFRKMEAQYQKKYENIQKMTLEIAEEKKQVDLERDALRKEQAEAAQKEADLDRREKLLEQEKAEVEKREQELVYQKNLELEKQRNEEMKLKRQREEYEYRLSLMEHELYEIGENTGTEPDSEQYLLRTEHQQQMDRLQKECTEIVDRMRREHEEEQQRLREEVEHLRAERVELLKKNLALSGDGQEETIREPVPETEIRDGDDALVEELTAETLKHYIEKNRPQFCNLKIHHADDGEQLSAESRGLKLRFLFSKPPQFDLLAERRNSSGLRRKIVEMNLRNPEITFQYEDGEVRATGYFTEDLPAERLLQKVEEVCACFKQEK